MNPRPGFVLDLLKPGSDQRLNRTGDLVRWLPDGNMEFPGRLDRQVKLRGHCGRTQAVWKDRPYSPGMGIHPDRSFAALAAQRSQQV